jgi:hypothetical protein
MAVSSSRMLTSPISNHSISRIWSLPQAWARSWRLQRHLRRVNILLVQIYFVYAQRFNIIPQLPPTGQGQSNEKGPYPEPSTGMHLLKCARRTDGSIMRDIVPLAQLRTLVDLVPRFGEQANRRLAKEAVLEYSSEFWLNKYFEKELFYALRCAASCNSNKIASIHSFASFLLDERCADALGSILNSNCPFSRSRQMSKCLPRGTILVMAYLRRFPLFSRGNHGSLIAKYEHAALFVLCHRNQILVLTNGDVLDYSDACSALQTW